MGKWTKAAKAVKAKLADRELKAADMEILMSKIAKLPLGQLKKLLDDEIIAIFQKYGVEL